LRHYLSQTDPANFGVLDYTRYGIWTEAGDWRERTVTVKIRARPLRRLQGNGRLFHYRHLS
ncbi:MAG: hypothetical protein WAK07_14055, partial [Rhodomicrobium sp.]